jgi:hypothetical protein
MDTQPAPSSAACEAGEVTTCTLSVAHGLGATRQVWVVDAASLSSWDDETITAGEDLVVVVVVRTPTPNYLRQASPDRGKYRI